MKKPDVARIRRVAREKFGYSQLRPGQEEVIRLVLDGHDVLSIMPTGSGKSAIYQIAALFIKGPTVVVSPLIALQKDQVESIEDKDVAEAAVVNSTIRAGARREAFEKLEDGELEFLFIAPEQFANDQTLQQLLANKPSLFVVDEAHCISEWGHDFRPDYARLGALIEALGHPRVIALTATASPQTQEEIVERLGMRKARTVVWGFDRPNIHLDVEKCPDVEIKDRILPERVRELGRPAIVYVATRKHAEDVAALLRDENLPAEFYHAGMKPAERHAVQERFMSDPQGLIVATSAFGMGVDKPDVRAVIHYDISDSIDSYFQEIGRAGRDGKPAHALLLYRAEDIGRRKAQSSSGKLEHEKVEELVEAIAEGNGKAVDPEEIAEKTELSEAKVTTAINRLEEAGAVEILPDGDVKAKRRRLDAADAAETVVEEQEAYRQQRRGRVEIMRDYAETGECRRMFLLNYFGERLTEPCGHCDNCEAGVAEEAKERNESLPFPLKSRVKHSKWGEGVVMRYEGDKVVVLFDTEGEKQVVTKFVIDNGLMEPA